MSNQEKNQPKIFHLLILFITVIILWLGSWYYINSTISLPEEQGQFGDKFGFINSLFSGLALAGVIYSIILQRKEINDTKEELFKQSRLQRYEQFETTFFNLINNQHEIANSIRTSYSTLYFLTQTKTRPVSGREFFVLSKKELHKIYISLESNKFNLYDKEYYNSINNEQIPDFEEEKLRENAKNEYTNSYYKIKKEHWDKYKVSNDEDKAKIIYAIFFNHYHFVLGHYFRHLYHILKFLEMTETNELEYSKSEDDKSNIENRMLTYAQFLQAQMSSPELFLLFYNSIIFRKSLRLIIKYNLLENLTVEDLITQNHDFIKEIKLKQRGRLLEI